MVIPGQHILLYTVETNLNVKHRNIRTDHQFFDKVNREKRFRKHTSNNVLFVITTLLFREAVLICC